MQILDVTRKEIQFAAFVIMLTYVISYSIFENKFSQLMFAYHMYVDAVRSQRVVAFYSSPTLYLTFRLKWSSLMHYQF